MDYKVIIALPAYNEETVLPLLFDKLNLLKEYFGESLKILVVNDGSTDKTGQILEEYSKQYSHIQYIHHAKNKGLGEAVKTIFDHLLSHYNDQDVLITLDADNTHNPNLIPLLVEKLKKERLDVVIASRFAPGGKEIGLSFMRKIFSRGAKLFFKLFFSIHNVNDYSCGFRAYRIGYLRKAAMLYNGQLITSSGFECMAEILARFSKIGVKAGEHPLVLEYHLKVGQSKMKVIKTIMGYFALLKKVRKPTTVEYSRYAEHGEIYE